MSLANSSTTLLWIGKANEAHFAGIHADLASHFELETCAAPEAVLAALKGVEPPLILIAQRYPGEFAAHDVAAWRRRWPLARFLSVLGPWCEGEPRSGQPWPGVPRVYWHQWSPRVVQDIERLLAGEPGPWSLPETASAEERLLAPRSREAERALEDAPAIAVCAPQRETAQALCDALAVVGYAPYWRRQGTPWRTGAAATVVDLPSAAAADWQRLAEVGQAAEAGVVVALLGFPRPDDALQARNLGAAALLSKPFDARDLQAILASGGR